MKKRSNLSVMWKLSGLVKPLAGYMVLAIFMGLAGHLCAVMITVFGGYGLLSLLDFPVALSMPLIFICLGVFALARGLLRYGEQACNHYIAFKLLALIRDKVFQALRRLCPAKLECRDKGNLIAVITSDIELLEVFYAHTISPTAIAFSFSLIMCLYIGSFHGLLAMIALAAYIAVGVCIPMFISKRSGEVGRTYRSKSGELSSFILSSLRGLNEIMQYNSGNKRLTEIHAQSEALSADEKQMKALLGQNTAMTNAIILFFDFAMLLCASWLSIKGELGFDGALLSTVMLMGSFGPVVALANLGSTLQNTFAAGERVLDILEEVPMVEEIQNGITVDFSSAEVEDVSFAYEDEPILSHVSLHMEKGEAVGIVGRSGSGKSTLLKLLMRFWETDEGAVRISDVDVREMNTTNLRNLEGYMTQETHLFHDSIKNNIRIARLDAKDADIEEACKKASIHDFILGLPKGYDTPVGELGDTLSGGERQRIGLARAFLHDAPLMILDEPTSNLDCLNEGIILKSIAEAKQEKTIILVSHRKSTMSIVDRVYAMQELSENQKRMC